ncbi:hypothetical protein PQ462_21910 [Flavobacterium sp. KACC 22758]|jgi:hypothetical protein|uniref:hypothetical protein n=1 Tax=Flavobacterium sp. KACC 22758 TaxID=3025667 RepID=UPI0023660DD0|nr:hypothetical protein [Flavobacterium sp. KACC 22758]WDF59353.1 hypothetical protein PQ462_21910 [Flavobacterium sp. KACC 22758]
MEIQGNSFVITFNCNMDDLFLMEIKSKGCVLGAILTIKNEIKIEINFYDPTRFKQEMEDEIDCYDFFYLENAVIIKEITIDEILVAVDSIVSKKVYERMVKLNF